MLFFKRKQPILELLNGLLLVTLISIVSIHLVSMPWAKPYNFSPLIIAIVIGMIFGNALQHNIPDSLLPGINFSAKHIKLFGIVLYGFRVTFQEIYKIGSPGLIIDVFTLMTVFFLSLWIGTKLFKLDRDSALLIGAGYAICGIAAILAVQGVLKSKSHKGSIAIITVVFFGTVALFLYPLLDKYLLNLTDSQFGIYVGGTVHEVSQVLVIGSAVSPEAESHALIVKMMRTMFLVPCLAALGILVQNKEEKINVQALPWFAIGFIAISGFNSLKIIPEKVVQNINSFDIILLTMAMAAIGIQTDLKEIAKLGIKALSLATILFAWLVISGYFVTCWMRDIGII